MSELDTVKAVIESCDDTMFDYTVAKYVLAGEKLRALCNPLFETTPVDNAYYSRFTKERTIITIMTPIEYMKEYLKNRYYIEMKGNMPFEDMKSGFYDPKPFYQTEENAPYIEEIEKKYAIHNPFVIINKFENYCDCFLVSFPTISQHNVNFFMNNTDKLRQFFASITPEIYALTQTLLPLPVDYQPLDPNEGFVISHAGNFVGRLCPATEKKVSLTNREKSILYLCAQGKAANEMAEELCLSRRTIENNLARIKNKYGCRSVTHLLSLFIDPERVPR